MRITDGAQGADVVIVAITEKSVADPPRRIPALPEGAVVVDAGNYVPQQRDGKIDAAERASSAIQPAKWTNIK